MFHHLCWGSVHPMATQEDGDFVLCCVVLCCVVSCCVVLCR